MDINSFQIAIPCSTAAKLVLDGAEIKPKDTDPSHNILARLSSHYACADNPDANKKNGAET